MANKKHCLLVGIIFFTFGCSGGAEDISEATRLDKAATGFFCGWTLKRAEQLPESNVCWLVVTGPNLSITVPGSNACDVDSSIRKSIWKGGSDVEWWSKFGSSGKEKADLFETDCDVEIRK